jgi:hypothetical protein
MLEFDDPETYAMLLEACKGHGVDPSASLETEGFFRKLLPQYAGESDAASIVAWLKEQVLQYFVAVSDRPKWRQNPQWPLEEGRPMIFAGQIDLSIQNGGIVSTIYHDDTSLYIFIGRKSQPVVVVQQF